MASLYVVATPLGNLADISPRAVEVLGQVATISAEDTRRTKKLLAHYDIATPIVSYHQHSGVKRVDELLATLRDGKDVALVTDAGTPGMNDPGGVLVDRVWRELGGAVTVVPIPGPTALAAALSVSGFPADQFTFLGFFPRKKGRATLLKRLAEEPGTYVTYESPHRIVKTLTALAEALPEEAQILVARELTKQFEQVVRGSAAEVAVAITDETIPARGEFALVIHHA